MMKIRGKDCSLHALLINTDCSNVDVLEDAAIRELLKSSYMPDRFWSGNFTDQTIEQDLMRLFKSSSGMTCGRGNE